MMTKTRKAPPNKNEDTTMISVCLPCPITAGYGSVHYPETLKHSITDAYCICHHVQCFQPSPKTLYLFSNESTFLDHDHAFKPNILAAFDANASSVAMTNKVINTLNIVPNIISIVVKEYKDNHFIQATDFNGLLTLELYSFKAST